MACALVAQADKPVPGIPDWELEYADAHGALAMIGIDAVAVAQQFERDGTPREVAVAQGRLGKLEMRVRIVDQPRHGGRQVDRPWRGTRPGDGRRGRCRTRPGRRIGCRVR